MVGTNPFEITIFEINVEQICEKLHCPLKIFLQNQNTMDGLDAKA